MKTIPSFTIDHIRLLRGIYVSRKDEMGSETVTTFDIRMKEPNREPALGQGALHTIEHLAAILPPPYRDWETDRKSTRLNSSHRSLSRMPSSA